MTPEKLLPQNVEAEAGVLGSLLIDPEAIVRVAQFLRPDDFYRNAHRDIYQAILDLYEGGAPADFIILCDELARRGKLDEIGGTAYIGSLANQVPTSRNALHYAEIVERCATLRRLIHAAGQIAGVAYNDPDADAAMERAEKLIREVARRRPERDGGSFAAAVDRVFDEILRAMEGEPLGMPTGLAGLDRHIVALKPTELVYACARPGMGKTVLGAKVGVAGAEYCAARGEGCVEWFTMEMKSEQQVKRIIADVAGINTRVLRAAFMRPDGSIDRERFLEARAAADAMKARLDGHLFIRDASYSVEQLHAQLARAVMERNCGLAIVDYFGLLKREGGTGREGRTERMTEISARLKEIARDLRIPVFVLAQLNREFAGRANPRPTLTDIRDTGATEQDADWVWAIHRPAYYDAAREKADAAFAQFAELLVLKARDGEAGVTIPLRFEREFTRLTDWPDGWAWPEDETRKGAQEG